jgi:pyruvate formate lyase activating enzyme
MNLEYKHTNTQPPTPDLLKRVLDQFRAAGCNAR